MARHLLHPPAAGSFAHLLLKVTDGKTVCVFKGTNSCPTARHRCVHCGKGWAEISVGIHPPVHIISIAIFLSTRVAAHRRRRAHTRACVCSEHWKRLLPSYRCGASPPRVLAASLFFNGARSCSVSGPRLNDESGSRAEEGTATELVEKRLHRGPQASRFCSRWV